MFDEEGQEAEDDESGGRKERPVFGREQVAGAEETFVWMRRLLAFRHQTRLQLANMTPGKLMPRLVEAVCRKRWATVRSFSSMGRAGAARRLWRSNRLSRLVKNRRLHMGDTGLAAALLGLDAAALYEDRETYGQLLDTFVLGELRRLASGHQDDIRFHHFRANKDGFELDEVLEHTGRRLAGIEVKASSIVTAADFRGLCMLAGAAGKRFAAGVVLYDGETSADLGDNLFAVPVQARLE